MISKSKDKLPYKETIRCSVFVLFSLSILLTITIDLSIYLYLGLPILSTKWCIILSLSIFAITFFYSMLRYSVKLKIFQGIIDDRIYISIKGIGKGSMNQIPIDSVIFCTLKNYSTPFTKFFALLLTSNASVRYDKSASIVSLPGYNGLGINIQYMDLSGKAINFLIPTKNPDLCGVIKLHMNHSANLANSSAQLNPNRLDSTMEVDET